MVIEARFAVRLIPGKAIRVKGANYSKESKVKGETSTARGG